MGRRAAAGGAPGLAASWRLGLGFGQLRMGFVLIVPLFLLYELGVLYTHTANGVDVVSEPLFDLVGRRRSHFLLVQLGTMLAYVAYLRWWRPEHRVHRDDIVAVLLESLIYALTLGSVILFIMDRVLGVPMLAILPRGAGESLDALAKVAVIAAGAGLFEELVFRLLGMGGLVLVLVAWGTRRSLALIVAAMVSSLAFSAAHHLGASGDVFHSALFLYRFLAGLIFAAIFYYRGLAHAVYSHLFYDFYVLAVMR